MRRHKSLIFNIILYFVSTIFTAQLIHKVIPFFRRDMMDDALMRPGRLEVQIEIGLPNEKGRGQIFKIHTRQVNITSSCKMS